MAIRFLANINQPAPGSEPYLTDLSSITLLKDLLPGFNVSSNPRGFTLLPDGRVVFGAFNGSTTELWITNGTEAGTVRVADLLITDPVGTNPQFLTRVGDSIYYSGLGDDGQELWRVSATTSVRVKDINPSGDSNPEGLTALPNNTFLFSANDGSHGVELWVSDGTSTNTTLLKDINTSGSSNPQSFAVLSDTQTLFNADDGTNGSELWITDGSEDGTTLVKNINPSGSSNPQDLTLLPNGKMLFSATDGTNGVELWVTDGTFDGTMMLKDIYGSGDSTPRDFVVLPNGTALFVVTINGDMQLWKSDGTSNGTMLVKDLQFDSSAGFLTLAGDKAYYKSSGQLIESDGTTDGTVVLTGIDTPFEMIALPEWLGINASYNYFEGPKAENFVVASVVGSMAGGYGIKGTTFVITSGNDEGYFALQNAGNFYNIVLTAAGVAAGAATIDFETGPNVFALTIEAQGLVSQTNVQTITITVKNADEAPPVVTPGQAFAYAEDQAAGFKVGKVIATDDIGVTSFAIIAGNANGFYAIDNSGNITLTAAGAAAAANDFETGPNKFTLTVRAGDGVGVTDTDTVTITINNLDGVTLAGTKKKDVLAGTSEPDVLNGKANKDTLTGGDDADRFVFDTKLKNKWADIITDFQVGIDTIGLDRGVFKKIGKAGVLKAKFFDIGKKADSGKDRILYDDKKGWALYDKDGKGGVDAIKFAKLDAGLNLSANDFLVI